MCRGKYLLTAFLRALGIVILAAAVAFIVFTVTALGADSEPHMKTKVCGPDETYCADVSDISGIKRLRVEGIVSTAPSTVSFANILKQSEISITTKSKTVLPSSTYTVPSGKFFALGSFGGSYDTQSPMYLRFEKQTGGTGSFDTLFRVTLKQHGQDESNHQIDLSVPVYVGQAGDVFRITYESALSKGTLWSGFTGIEY